MDIKSIIRTSAIIYADETSTVSTKTIQRKFIEAVYIDNNNGQLVITELLTEIEKKFNLSFSIEETTEIINKADVSFFDIQHNGKNVENIIVKLSENRFQYLKNKEITNDFEKFTKEFTSVCIDCKLTDNQIKDILFKYLYELLNTNIQLYLNILKPSNQQHNFTIDSSKFDDKEIWIINEFLSWNNPEKNIALFKIISYCIEYALVANHSSGDTTYLASLRNKQFYLDNNILYRALGINGDNRKQRTIVFLKKCRESGQKLIISKYSKKEFVDTIDYHINQLKKLPFGRINPRLFSKYCVSPSFYEFYHYWRNGRITYGFDSFHAFVLSEYDSLLKFYKIDEDYKIPFDENNPEINAEIENYKNEIQALKSYGFENSHRFDAQNCYLIEKKRNDNNRNIQDTKYYLITTDQKLKKWDDSHSKNQSITLLPSHWMGLLLKYYSRTDDDFKSFVSFLKLKQHEDLIDEYNLQVILSGISEITEDFKRQDTVMERMVERKFAGIIDSKNPIATREGAKKFAKEIIEDELDSTKKVYQEELKNISDKYQGEINTISEVHQEELNNISQKYEFDKEQLQIENKRKIDELFAKEQQKRITERYDSVCLEIKKINKMKHNALIRAEEDFKTDKFKFLILPVAIFLVLLVCVIIFSWDKMEKITYIFSMVTVGLTYTYIAIYGKSFDPTEYFNAIKEKNIKKAFQEFMVDLNDLKEYEELKIELKNEIDAFQNFE
ncbi:MAG: hypothetical protein PHP53_24050 [Prolixibacteraceae bacterium]|nr:hypothetical protein [Prolixibacteraceae bacterium]